MGVTVGQPVGQIQPAGGRIPLFTTDEVTLLLGLAHGLSDAEIGAMLQPWRPLSGNAVRLRVFKLRHVAGARNRPHLVCLALQWGVLKLPPRKGST